MVSGTPTSPANNIIPQDQNAPSVPGIGMGGVTMCPFGFQKSPCLKQGCELWVELFYDKQKVGRCSLAWNAVIATEVTTQLRILNERLVPTEIVPPKPGGG